MKIEKLIDPTRNFMQPRCWREKYRCVENTHGETTIVPASVCDSDDLEDYAPYVDGDPAEISDPKLGWLYHFSAPGYLDCTPLGVAETEAEAIEALSGEIEL